MTSAATIIQPTNVEVHFDTADIIVSKTNLKGKITYANTAFCTVSGYSLPELIGAPHSLIRHPDMPRAVFKLLWDTIQDGHEVFAYVKNLAKSGAYYWVFAHVTPSYGRDRKMIGFHSNRRAGAPHRRRHHRSALRRGAARGSETSQRQGRTRRRFPPSHRFRPFEEEDL